jgi:hypothetical protein
MSTKPRNLKVSGLERPRFLQFLRRKAAEFNQAGLVRMKRQQELPQPIAHRVPEAAGVALMLETDNEVVGIPDHDNILSTQISNLENVNTYEVSTQITDLQSQIETSYSLTSQLQQLSLVKYL